jgi:hypothetical protein
MAETLTSLTELAVAVFKEKAGGKHQPPPWLSGIYRTDPVLEESQRAAYVTFESRPKFQEFVKALETIPELASLAPREGGLDPFVLTPAGGSRTSLSGIIRGLFSAAFSQIFFLRLPSDEGTYVRSVLENFDELRRAARGERVRVHIITGLAQITLPETKQISTPWGVIRPVAPFEPHHLHFEFGKVQTTCTLAEPKLYPMVFDRAASPQHKFDPAEMAPSSASVLLPLACALASKDPSKPAVPVITFATMLLPFQGGGFSYSTSPLGPILAGPSALDAAILDVEEWARTVNAAHTPTVDIAARRLASAISRRLDRADALVDAVMVWENLVGTSTEVSFRVTAALAKMLEPIPAGRSALRKSLGGIYNLRSRVVHGGVVEHSEIDKACTEAISVAIRALRASYRKGREWLRLGSTERADAILLEWD